ncbi:hypothetical protein [Psychromonas sp. L1A2]|uniref:hypothetical protein n=1 Tax=Psychromonas sp. L1A2 TaxID=2686356 RepID=UPI0013572FD4|nr:hypothetical protein [Psychromonas sp. L1A2]
MKLQGYGIELSEVTEDKIEKIRLWRNHPDIASVMLDKTEITPTQQLAWFDSLACKNDRLYLLISYKGEDIGMISALSVTPNNVSTDSKPQNLPLSQAEKIAPGLYIEPNSKYKNSVLAFSPSLVFIEYLFKQGCCTELEAQVFEHNESAIRYNKMLGYKEGVVDDQGLLTMTLNIIDFESAKDKLSKILRF